MVLVSAPPGFGKTTLIADWIHQTKSGARDVQFAWLSLDENDNDLSRFLGHFVMALQSIDNRLGEDTLGIVREMPSVSASLPMTNLVNDLAVSCAYEGDLMMLLSDYHTIHALAVHDVITFFI